MVKTYVLLSSLDSKAPIYQQVSKDERVLIEKTPLWSVTLRQTFQDKEGVGVTIRYKENSKFIEQEKQIKEENLPANIGWTQNERRARHFRHGVLTTSNANLQRYLEAHPAYDKFEGSCDDFPTRCYKLLDEVAETQLKNTEIRQRVYAAKKVIDLDLEGKQELILRLFGSFTYVPSDPLECENILMDYLDEADERGIEEILREKINLDEEISILIGKAIKKDILSFDKAENNISKKVKDKWVNVREISSEYPLDERKRYFSEFLVSDAGATLLAELKSDVEGKKAPKTEEPKEDVTPKAPKTKN